MVLEVLSFCDFFVNVEVLSDPHAHSWLISFVHSPTLWNEKEKFWYDLEHSGNSFHGPWLCLGDFNVVIQQSEKWGGRPVSSCSTMNGMRHFLWQTGMLDLGFSSSPFTWTNDREGNGLILERLDRGVANGEWRTLFPRTTVTHLTRHASDHSPILLNTVGDSDNHPRPFRFESFWAEDARSFDVVKSA